MIRLTAAEKRAFRRLDEEEAEAMGKPMKCRRQEEDRLHQRVAEYLAAVLPPDIPWTTIAHGLRLTVGQAVKAKRRGTKPGWPDIIIVFAGKAVFIELKRPKDLLSDKGRTSDAQRATHAWLALQGCTPWVATSIRDVEDCLRAHGVPLRGAIAA